MTIRTLEDFEKLNSSWKEYSKFLPVELAYKLRELTTQLKLRFNTSDNRLESIKKINEWLQSTDYKCEGYYSKENKTSMHKCEACFFENVRTFGEANKNIQGKDSVGVHFKDPDDDYNDWIYVSWDILTPIEEDEPEVADDYDDEEPAVSPCPFCGEVNYTPCSTEDDHGIETWSIVCNKCGGEGGDADSKEEAIQKWNMRAGKKFIGISKLDPNSEKDGDNYIVWINFRSNILGKFRWLQDAEMFKRYLKEKYKKEINE